MCNGNPVMWGERNDKGLIKLLSNDDLSFGALNGPFVGVLMDVWVRQRFGITGLWCCGGAENANLNYGCRELEAAVESDTGRLSVENVLEAELRNTC
jgi:hypothetical protein